MPSLHVAAHFLYRSRGHKLAQIRGRGVVHALFIPWSPATLHALRVVCLGFLTAGRLEFGQNYTTHGMCIRLVLTFTVVNCVAYPQHAESKRKQNSTGCWQRLCILSRDQYFITSITICRAVVQGTGRKVGRNRSIPAGICLGSALSGFCACCRASPRQFDSRDQTSSAFLRPYFRFGKYGSKSGSKSGSTR